MTSETTLKRGFDSLDNGDAKRSKISSVLLNETSSRPAQPKIGIKESDVGITEYVYHGSGSRITGILKQRYTDFQVNEIAPDGKVIHLEDLGIDTPKKSEEEKDKEKKERKERQEEKRKEDKQEFDISEQDKNVLTELLGKDDTEKLISMVGTRNKMETTKSYPDKMERTKVHKLIRKIFDNSFETATTEDDKIIVGANSFRNHEKRENTHGNNAPGLIHNLGPRKTFLWFNMYKQNKETMEVANILAKIMGIPVKHVKYAGTKDRRGVTVQKASLENVPVERANSLNRILRGCQIGGFEYSDTPVNLAALAGNEFIITLRDAKSIDSSITLEEAVSSIVKSLSTIGFVNYYGMQRFGTFSVSTHEVGKEILNGNWKAAGELILSEQEIVVPSSRDARHIWKQTRDANMALKKMPRKCSAEFSLLSRLDRSEKEDDGEYSSGAYFNAIMGIPRNLRIMYGHSYQSYVWNVVASRRVQLFGYTVVPGDLVLINKKVQDGDMVEDVKNETVTTALAVTEDDIKADKYTIHDIVLPTPGYDVVYPENEELRNSYVEVMKKDGLDPFNMSRRVREFSLPGTYRKVIARAGNLEYYIRKYDTFTDELVRTDLEILNLLKKATEEGKKDISVDRILPGDPNGDKSALIIKMQLPSSTYATMALRELIVEDTSIHGGVPKKN
ncbi:hypothetical protein FOA43_000480 [Brettanomyces nanus]|uniref:TRUD domain-containing protein n=1 Tax=Eeniella nana TaxID=13502 RepID=A0A875S178_EENNA|nr:uncharacterized protein FOA43_000480 [Brettanomyces nanus]QPG73174.1 hypothetical protein FOA43_000480 [Brettanomyces nanus]